MYKCIDTLYFVGADGICSGACTVIYAIYNKYITLNDQPVLLINVKSLIALHMPIKWVFFFKLWGKKFMKRSMYVFAI